MGFGRHAGEMRGKFGDMIRRAMTRVILGLCAAALIACGGSKPTTQPTNGAAVAGGYAAARWVPGQARYALMAKTVREAQQGARDLIEMFGVFADVTVAEASAELTQVLTVDPLSPDALASIGIDLESGFALFSESYNPTLVARLSSPPAFRAFVEQIPNLKLQSVVVEGIEVFSAPLPKRSRISWAIADDWLWVHVQLPEVPDDSATWFASSRKPGAITWGSEIAVAKGQTEPPLIGFIDAAWFVADVGQRVPEVGRCTSTLPIASIGKLALRLFGTPQEPHAYFTLDVGALAPRIESVRLPVPDGWSTATAQVPIAAQANIDLAAARPTLEPCLRLFGVDLRDFDELGIRAGRGYIRSFDPDEREGTGAVSLDLTHKKYFDAQLDRVPMRSAMERKRTFGPYTGRQLSIPMFLTVDYVLQDRLMLAGVGDGQLSTMIGKGGTVPAVLAELAVQPQGLSIESWTELLKLLEVDHARSIAERLQRWRAASVSLSMDGPRLVLAASGKRR